MSHTKQKAALSELGKGAKRALRQALQAERWAKPAELGRCACGLRLSAGMERCVSCQEEFDHYLGDRQP